MRMRSKRTLHRILYSEAGIVTGEDILTDL